MTEADRTLKVFLFRMVLEPNLKHQKNFADINISRPELLTKILQFSPRYFTSDRKVYLTSKVSTIDNNGLYFKFGIQRIKKGILFDEQLKDFIESDKSDADYAHCFYDTKRQVLAIEKKNGTVTPKSLALKLAIAIDSVKKNELYSNKLTAEEKMLLVNSTCKIRPICEPNEFINKIESAYRVTTFTVSLFPPNPTDFNDALKKPLDNYMEATGAVEGTVTIKNSHEGLESSRLVSLSRQIGAYGANAEARIVDEEGGKPYRIMLNRKENYASIDLKFPITALTVNIGDYLQMFMNSIRKMYEKIHNGRK